MWLWLLGACELLEEGDPYLTDVEDLQIIGLVLEPPEARPGQTVFMTSFVADPRERGYDLMIWSCLPFSDGCLEASVGTLPKVERAVDWRTPLLTLAEVPPEAEQLLVVPGLELTVLVWALACEPGLCPLIDDVAAAGPWPGPEWDDLYARLAHPEEEIRDLPMEGVHLAARRLLVSHDEDRGDLNENPTYTVVTGSQGGALEPGRTQSWNLRVIDRQGNGMHAYGFATGGRITARERVIRNEVDLSWTAPEPLQQDRVRVWIVIEEEEEGNGSAVFMADFTR